MTEKQANNEVKYRLAVLLLNQLHDDGKIKND